MPRRPGLLAWELADRIGHANALFGATLRSVVAESPLTVAEAIALVVLASEPAGRTQVELGRALGVTRQHAHAMTRRLTALGLTRGRRRGREVSITPTPSAHRLIAKLRPAAEARLAQALAGLTRSERAALHRLTGRLVEVLMCEAGRSEA